MIITYYMYILYIHIIYMCVYIYIYAITELQKARERRLKKRRTGGQAKMRERRADELKEKQRECNKIYRDNIKNKVKKALDAIKKSRRRRAKKEKRWANLGLHHQEKQCRKYQTVY